MFGLGRGPDKQGKEATDGINQIQSQIEADRSLLNDSTLHPSDPASSTTPEVVCDDSDARQNARLESKKDCRKQTLVFSVSAISWATVLGSTGQ
ncbi:hypothetical protein K435DRAFT_877092 [Dendrothele bispora CBS 962.96]|uniref:Uncharacterized protein n=1 Tax=Dendrothele bispora (strain CBS 962.96) TaxID=1314807 RepID=A0A4S8KQQ6_DENBC|nr:hypothetical protein K435DRAFT_877092 [Dendrothele bispora CBS 962.96]